MRRNVTEAFKEAKMAVLIAEKTLSLHPSFVHLLSDVDLVNRHINSAFLPERNTIIFEEHWIEQASTEEISFTAFHEVRHYYQYHVFTNKNTQLEPLDVLFQWEKEFQEYHRPLEMNLEEKHLFQAIEIDAIAFACYMMKKFFQKECYIPDSIKQLVMDKMKSFEY